MKLENSLILPGKKDIGFYIASGACLTAGLVDGLLTVKGLNSGIAKDLNPLVHFLVDNYGIEAGVAILKSNSLMAVMAGEIIERRSTSSLHKNLSRYVLYGGTALSGVGIAGWLNL